jgi:DNA ligase-1
MKNEFVQLAQTFDPKKHDVRGWWLSEKLDGMRCWWDGGVTRGLKKIDVPWANTDADDRYINIPKATGLWSRNGQPICAPVWWLDEMPKGISLDGELWYGRGPGKRQKLMSVVKQLIPDPADWKIVRFMVFDSPDPSTILADRPINTPFFKKELVGCADWAIKRGLTSHTMVGYDSVYSLMTEYTDGSRICRVPQLEIPYTEPLTWINAKLSELLEDESEGVMIRNPYAGYRCTRTGMLLKYKPWNDAEGIVIGYSAAREGKIAGLMGALLVTVVAGVPATLELSGFLDTERDFGDVDAYAWATTHPGERCPDWINHRQYPRGSTITFKYRELSRDGVPLEARFWRKS